MIANVGSNLPIDLIAQSAAGQAKPAAPAPGGQEAPPVPVGNDPGSAQDSREAAGQAAQARSQVLDANVAAATGTSVHPNEVHLIRDPESGMVAVQVMDSVTGDEISQIPSDKMLKTMASINKNIGLLLDEKS